MSGKALSKKNPGLTLSKAVAREHLAQAGFKATPGVHTNDRLTPLRETLDSAFSEKAGGGFSKRLIRKLASA